MSSIRAWTLTAEEMEGEFNKVKDILIDYLAGKGFLSHEDAENLMLTRQVVVKEPRLISYLYRKILGKEASVPRIMVVEGTKFGPEEKKNE